MQIGAISSYQPYIYNPNGITSSSLSKVNAIGNDLLASKTDFSGVTEDKATNQNPLRMGETSNFADILLSQMQMGRMNAERLMNPVNQEANASLVAGVNASQQNAQAENNSINMARMQQAAQAYQMNMIA